jgi:hypothetical protein
MSYNFRHNFLGTTNISHFFFFVVVNIRITVSSLASCCQDLIEREERRK